jgi:hypothetical protein
MPAFNENLLSYISTYLQRAGLCQLPKVDNTATNIYGQPVCWAARCRTKLFCKKAVQGFGQCHYAPFFKHGYKTLLYRFFFGRAFFKHGPNGAV